jgi:O-antigen/teichoic acid export membrane protein
MVPKWLLTLIDQGILSIANFLTGVIIGRVCSKEEFGLFLLGFTIIAFVQDIQGSFISTPYTIYIPRLKGIEKAQYTGSTLVHQFFLSVLAILILAITHVIIPAELWPKGFLSVIVALLFVIAFILMREYVRQVCFAIMKIALILDISFCVLQVSGLLLLVESHDMGNIILDQACLTT